VNQSVLLRRSLDKPWKWAVLFALFSPITIAFYCVTRRTWRPLLYGFLGLGSVSLAWGIALEAVKSLSGINHDGSGLVDLGISLSAISSLYVSGLLAIRHIRDDAVALQATQQEFQPKALRDPVQNKRPRRVSGIVRSRLSSASQKRRFIGILTLSVLATLLAGYAVHTFTVETMIKQNPVLAAVSATGTRIRIKHFNCEGLYGYYDVFADEIQICTGAHSNQLESSKESTIRHEAWHVVQACASIIDKDDEWGNFVVVNPPEIKSKVLSADDEAFIKEFYPKEQWNTEREARLVELYMTDKDVIDTLRSRCDFTG
jgi:hypothetical protein